MKRSITWTAVFLLFTTTLFAQRRMERLNRGVVAVRTGSQVFISWRLLGLDPGGIGFNIYRSANGAAAVKLNSAVLVAGTNYTDATANLTVRNVYYVRAVVNGAEQAASSSYTLVASPQDKPCFTVPLRAGAPIHFVWVGDLDGDGEYDYVVDRSSAPGKIEAYKRDGTFLWDVDYGPNSMNRDNISPGSATIDVGNWDGVTVYDLDGDGKAEVITKIANGVRFGDGSTWNNSSNTRQWLAILNGETGAMRSYVTIPNDYTSAGSWACSLGIGYLDGVNPSVIGKFKNRNSDGSFNLMVAAFRFSGSNTALQWKWLRGASAAADGHQIRIIDVDGNGTDELCDIGYCLNSNGTLRYSLAAQGIIHGDRTQIGKLDPNRSGIQGYGVQQNNPSGLHEYYYDANSGNVLWKHITGVGDIGRGAAGDIDPRYSGFEVWAFNGVFNAPSNTRLTEEPSRPYPNFRIWWDGDVLSENLHDRKIEKWNYTSNSVSRLLTAWQFDNATGSDRDAPMFYGDIVGDWREEMICTNNTYSALVVFTTNLASATRIYTLAHNPAYRNCMTIKGYMQSHHTDFYLGNGMPAPPRPNISYSGTGIAASLTVDAVAGIRDFDIYPNPLNVTALTVTINMEQGADVTLSVTDEQGRLVMNKNLGRIQQGIYTTKIDNSLPPGNYVISMKTSKGVQSKTFIKL